MKKLVILGLILGFNTSVHAGKLGESQSATCTESHQANRAAKADVSKGDVKSKSNDGKSKSSDR